MSAYTYGDLPPNGLGLPPPEPGRRYRWDIQWNEGAIFQPQRHTSLVQQVADHLRRRIVTGDLSPGRKLPPMDRLAHLYGVSRTTMGAALHALAALGFVRISHGVGVFVTRPRSSAALLNHAWLQATPMELALMRSGIDERMPVVVARQVATATRLRLPRLRLPRMLSDITHHASERSAWRPIGAEVFLKADLAFHRSIAASIRGAEITVQLHDHIGQKLMPALLTVADVLAGDEVLDRAHRALATAISNGEARTAARLARTVARQELQSMQHVVG